jgi:RNA polymerase sigma-70 factor (ECF subfamily)
VTIGQDQAWIEQRLDRWRTVQDREALGELLKWQRGRAFATAFRILGNEADAEDAVQQACIKILNLRRGFENSRAFETAVYWAVTQCALNWKRLKGLRQNRETAVGIAEPAHESTALAAVERAEALKALNEELSQLDVRERAAVVLCCQEGLNLTEAAESMEESRETVRDRLARTLKRLREKLQRKGVELSPLLLLGLLRESSPMTAPASLCGSLDSQFPASRCSKIAEATVPKEISPEVLALGSSTQTSAKGMLLAIALLMLACAGIGIVMMNKSGTRDGSQATAEEPSAGKAVVRPTAEIPKNEEESEVKPARAGMIATAAMVSALTASARADDTAGRKEVSKDEYKAAVRAVLANEKNAKSDKSSSAPAQAVPMLKEFQERD